MEPNPKGECRMNKLKGMKEIRGGNLRIAIRAKLPNVGFIKLSTETDRKCFLTWRDTDFIVTSRLIIKELSFGRTKPNNTIETENSSILQGYLKA